jgi:hypothetical protein
MPGIMRLFVRVEGHTPFCLILADNLLPEHLEEIAVKYFRENWHSTRQAPDLVLIRRVKFKNNDRMFDFRKKKRLVKAPLISGGDRNAQSAVSVYQNTFQPELIKQELIATNTPGSLGAYASSELIIKGATLGRLVMKITDPIAVAFERDVLLMTYRSFATATDLLDRLIDRYEVPQIARLGHAQRSPPDRAYYDDVVVAVRAKVFEVLEEWVDKYYFDFSEDTVHGKLHRFVREKVDTNGAPSKILSLMRHGDRSALSSRKLKPLPGVLNKSLLPTAILGRDDPKGLAHQLTLLTLHVHNAINAPELLGKQWEGPTAANVPNFIQYRDFINRVSNWVTYAIVSEQGEGARITNMAQLIRLCDELLRINNFDMLVAVYGGITDPSVSRLSQTYAALPQDARSIFPKLEELLSNRGTTKMVKHAMASAPRPRFPSLVIHLRDLVHLDQLPAESDGAVNFMRCVQQYNLVKFLLDGQHQRLEYVPNAELMGEFTYWKIVDDRILNTLSHERQAR